MTQQHHTPDDPTREMNVIYRTHGAVRGVLPQEDRKSMTIALTEDKEEYYLSSRDQDYFPLTFPLLFPSLWY